jgi:hypothetical protein
MFKAFGWFKEIYDGVKDTPEFQRRTAELEQDQLAVENQGERDDR